MINSSSLSSQHTSLKSILTLVGDSHITSHTLSK
jgi:hypothetical protein